MRSSFETHSMVCLLSDISALKSLDARLHLRELLVRLLVLLGVCLWLSRDEWYWIFLLQTSTQLLWGATTSWPRKANPYRIEKSFHIPGDEEKISPSYRRTCTHTWRAESWKHWERENTRKKNYHHRKNPNRKSIWDCGEREKGSVCCVIAIWNFCSPFMC